MKDTCHDTIAFLDDYLDGVLPAEQLATFEHHLSHCPYCRDYLKTYRDTIYLARGTGEPASGESAVADPPAQLVEAILHAVSRGSGGDHDE